MIRSLKFNAGTGDWYYLHRELRWARTTRMKKQKRRHARKDSNTQKRQQILENMIKMIKAVGLLEAREAVGVTRIHAGKFSDICSLNRQVTTVFATVFAFMNIIIYHMITNMCYCVIVPYILNRHISIISFQKKFDSDVLKYWHSIKVGNLFLKFSRWSKDSSVRSAFGFECTMPFFVVVCSRCRFRTPCFCAFVFSMCSSNYNYVVEAAMVYKINYNYVVFLKLQLRREGMVKINKTKAEKLKNVRIIWSSHRHWSSDRWNDWLMEWYLEQNRNKRRRVVDRQNNLIK